MRGSRGIAGILLGLASGLAFGAGGAIVKPLLESGWSPGAAVFLRITVAAVLLAVPGLIALRFDLRPLWRAKWIVLIYSVVAIAGLVLVIGPTGGPLDPFGVVIAGVAMLGVAVYYVLGERADLGVPPM